MKQTGQMRGFTLIELLVSLALLAAFALVATRVFTTSMRAIDQSGRTQNMATRFDSMLYKLREDVWSAKNIDSADERALALTDAKGQLIRWTMGDDGSITRTIEQISETEVWPEVASGLHFLRNGASLRLHTQRGDEIALANLTELSNR